MHRQPGSNSCSYSYIFNSYIFCKRIRMKLIFKTATQKEKLNTLMSTWRSRLMLKAYVNSFEMIKAFFNIWNYDFYNTEYSYHKIVPLVLRIKCFDYTLWHRLSKENTVLYSFTFTLSILYYWKNTLIYTNWMYMLLNI